jgi:hypothetical protein
MYRVNGVAVFGANEHGKKRVEWKTSGDEATRRREHTLPSGKEGIPGFKSVGSWSGVELSHQPWPEGGGSQRNAILGSSIQMHEDCRLGPPSASR